MTLKELLEYHATEGGLIDAELACDLVNDAGMNTDDLDLDQLADDANAAAIAATLRGDVLGARMFKTEDGYTFTEMPCGTITDGDMGWPNENAFATSMQDHGIEYVVTRVT